MSQLLTKYKQVKEENPKSRIRDIATKMGVSEAELVNAQAEGKVSTLQAPIGELLLKIESLGKVMALTRNESCVSEIKGVYTGGKFENNHVGLFFGGEIDLRIFLKQWIHIFAVEVETAKGVRRSLQFFNAQGEAVHKIYLLEESNLEAYHQLVQKYQVSHKEKLSLEPTSWSAPNKADNEVDWEKVKEQWRNMKDTHHFFTMLKKYKITRQQAFRQVPEFARQVDNKAARQVLDLARDTKCPIMIFVSNSGCIEIFTGEVKNLKEFGTWYNVLDPNFNLHLQTKNIVESWVVKKPAEAGIVTSLEIFDKDGNTIATFFGKRKPAIPELEQWRQILDKIQ